MYMTRTQYREYMRSFAWKEVRKKVLKRDKYACRHCGSLYGDLQVHHVTYIRLGEELLEDLLTLCDACHVAEHQRLIEQGLATSRKEMK